MSTGDATSFDIFPLEGYGWQPLTNNLIKKSEQVAFLVNTTVNWSSSPCVIRTKWPSGRCPPLYFSIAHAIWRSKEIIFGISILRLLCLLTCFFLLSLLVSCKFDAAIKLFLVHLNLGSYWIEPIRNAHFTPTQTIERCVFPMVAVSILSNYHRDDAPHFTITVNLPPLHL